jgi:hypothetical protein
MAAQDLQNILDNAVAGGLPGVTAVVVDRSGLTFHGCCSVYQAYIGHPSSNVALAEIGASGVLSTETSVRNDISAVRLASLTKRPVSLAVLKLLEERREPSLGLE